MSDSVDYSGRYFSFLVGWRGRGIGGAAGKGCLCGGGDGGDGGGERRWMIAKGFSNVRVTRGCPIFER